MIFRCILCIAGLFCLLLSVYAKDNLPTIDISDFTYKGTDKTAVKSIPDLLKEQFAILGMFEITEKKENAEYILTCIIEEKQQELILSMEITAAAGSKFTERVVKKTHPDNGLQVILQEAVEYIHRKIFPFETITAIDEDFFTVKSMKDFYKDDVIDRNKETMRKEAPSLFDPLNKKIFKKHRLQFLPSCEVSFPFLIDDDQVRYTLFFHLPCYFYLFTSEYVMLALLGEGFYFSLDKQISEDQFSFLDIFAYGGGIGVCFPLPFYRQVAFHLNVSGGCSIAILTHDLYADGMLKSFDPYIHSVFEIEHVITQHISFSIKCSYIWIIYHEDNVDMHLLQTGIGFGIRI